MGPPATLIAAAYLRLAVGDPPLPICGSPCTQAEMHTPWGPRPLWDPWGAAWGGQALPPEAGAMSLVLLVASPAVGAGFHGTWTKPRFVAPGISTEGACSQKWKRAAFPLSLTSPPSTDHQTPSNLGRWEEL